MLGLTITVAGLPHMLIRTTPLLKESVRSGMIASLAMMPFGFVFQFFGLRVGHYGPKFAELLFGTTAAPVLFAQHLVIGWLSALPLLVLLLVLRRAAAPVATGAGYGLLYYILVNSLALPLYFGDPLPWQLGLDVIYPSLVVHLVYGASIGITAKAFVVREAEKR